MKSPGSPALLLSGEVRELESFVSFESQGSSRWGGVANYFYSAHSRSGLKFFLNFTVTAATGVAPIFLLLHSPCCDGGIELGIFGSQCGTCKTHFGKLQSVVTSLRRYEEAHNMLMGWHETFASQSPLKQTFECSLMLNELLTQAEEAADNFIKYG